MAVYTRKGDGGKTGFVCGKCVSKGDDRVWCIGSLDEINCWIGVIVAWCEREELKEFLIEIQKDLFLINSILAGEKRRFSGGKTKKLEGEIDRMERGLPKISNFVFPGGSRVSSMIGYGRVLTRRAERHLVELNEKQRVHLEILSYVNRLSDYFFVCSRYECFCAGAFERVWK
jgi:cob(I)alamin adenosyltransferase